MRQLPVQKTDPAGDVEIFPSKSTSKNCQVNVATAHLCFYKVVPLKMNVIRVAKKRKDYQEVRLNLRIHLRISLYVGGNGI